MLRLLLWALFAFWLWVGLALTLRTLRVPLALFVGAVLSWVASGLLLPSVLRLVLQLGRTVGIPPHLITMR